MTFLDKINKPRQGTYLPADDPEGKASGFIKSTGTFILEIVKVIVISLAIIIPVRYFLIQPFYVKGASMEPSFYDNEYLVIDEITYRFEKPARGDIIVFRYPQNPSQFFIKRVIGLPGEKVEIRNGRVIIYNDSNPKGQALDERDYLDTDVLTAGSDQVTLSPNEYYVLGDNREQSLDSRRIGPIDKKYIIGRTWVRAWPFNKWRVFHNPDYGL
ncbi:MAG: signal peptidase I [Patescibacteria group bacterium]|nr:signal peptidase I [Patescibacteria group bacterium]